MVYFLVNYIREYAGDNALYSFIILEGDFVYTEKPIPYFEFPAAPKGREFKEEKLVSVKEYFKGEILTEPVYFNQGCKGSYPQCFVRRGVAERIEKALAALPEGLTFKVFDGWRSFDTQQALYDKYYKSVKENNPLMNEEQLEEETKKFVSKPSPDPNNPSVHNTGGAVDLTIYDREKERELDMGTVFDDFTQKAYTRSFEEENSYDNAEEVRANRRLLYYVMTGAGFTNLPTEWWHFDYGDNFWSFYSGSPAVYNGLINRLP